VQALLSFRPRAALTTIDTPMGSSTTYVGLRGPQPDYGHGGPSLVGVIRNGDRRNLELNDDRMIDGGFEWGYEGAGPRRLAQAILNDFLGFEVDLIVASAFLRDVVARLPAEFELTGERVAAWVNDRLVLSCVVPDDRPGP
jgi:hypothetical protein